MTMDITHPPFSLDPQNLRQNNAEKFVQVKMKDVQNYVIKTVNIDETASCLLEARVFEIMIAVTNLSKKITDKNRNH